MIGWNVYQWSLTIDFTNNLDSRHCCIKINQTWMLNRRRCLVSLTAFLLMTYSTLLSRPVLACFSWNCTLGQERNRQKKTPQTLGSTPSCLCPVYSWKYKHYSDLCWSLEGLTFPRDILIVFVKHRVGADDQIENTCVYSLHKAFTSAGVAKMLWRAKIIFLCK